MIVITNGASPFGRLVLQHLLKRVPEAATELGTIYSDVSQGEWSVATPTLEDMLGHERVSLRDALRAAGQTAGS